MGLMMFLDAYQESLFLSSRVPVYQDLAYTVTTYNPNTIENLFICQSTSAFAESIMSLCSYQTRTSVLIWRAIVFSIVMGHSNALLQYFRLSFRLEINLNPYGVKPNAAFTITHYVDHHFDNIALKENRISLISARWWLLIAVLSSTNYTIFVVVSSVESFGTLNLWVVCNF